MPLGQDAPKKKTQADIVRELDVKEYIRALRREHPAENSLGMKVPIRELSSEPPVQEPVREPEAAPSKQPPKKEPLADTTPVVQSDLQRVIGWLRDGKPEESAASEPSPERLKFQGDLRATVQAIQPLAEWLHSWMVEPPVDPSKSRKVRIEGGSKGPFDFEIPSGMSNKEAEGYLEMNREALGLPPVELGIPRQAWNKGAKSFSEFTGAVMDFVAEGTYNALGQAMGATPEEAAPGYQAMQEDQARRNTIMEGNYPLDPKKDTYQGVGSLVSPSYMVPKAAGLLGGFTPALGLSLIPGVGLPMSMAAMGADGYQARYDAGIANGEPEDIARKHATVAGVVNTALGVSQLGIARLGGVVAKVVPKGLGEIPIVGRLATGAAAAVENAGYNNVAMLTEKTLNGEPITGTDFREASLSGILLGGPLGFAHGYHPPVGYAANKAAIKEYVKENARIFRENTDPSRSQELADLAKLPDVGTDWETAARAYNDASDKMAYARELPDGDPLKASIENRFKLVVSLMDNVGREQGWKGEALRKWTVEQRDVEEAAVVEDAMGAVAADVPVETAVRKVSLDTRVRAFVEEEARANPEAYAGLDAGELKKAKAARRADPKARAQKKGIGTLSDEEVLANLAKERTLADHMAQFGDGVDLAKNVGEVQESQAALAAAKGLVAGEPLTPEVKAPVEQKTAKQILEAKRAGEAPLMPEEQALVDSTDLSDWDSLMAELDDTPRGAVEVEAPQPARSRLRSQEAPMEPQDTAERQVAPIPQPTQERASSSGEAVRKPVALLVPFGHVDGSEHWAWETPSEKSLSKNFATQEEAMANAPDGYALYDVDRVPIDTPEQRTAILSKGVEVVGVPTLTHESYTETPIINLRVRMATDTSQRMDVESVAPFLGVNPTDISGVEVRRYGDMSDLHAIRVSLASEEAAQRAHKNVLGEPQDASGAIPDLQADPRVIEAATALLEPHTAEVRMNGETLPRVNLIPKPTRERPTTKKDSIPSLRKRLDESAERVRADLKDPTKLPLKRQEERRKTLFGLLTSIQEERPDIVNSGGMPAKGLMATVAKLRAEFGDTRLLQEVEPLEQATVRKPRPEGRAKADDQQEGVFRNTLREANINPDHLPKGIVKQVLDGKLTWSHGAALLFERTGMGRVEWSTSKEGAPVATLVPHKLEGKSWETSVSVANKLWTRLNGAVQEAAVKALGEENLQRSMAEAEVLSASRATFETRYKASNLQGGWVWDFKGKARAAFAEAGRGAHLSETQLDHVAQMSFQFAEAWASLRPGKTSRDWYETRFDPRVIKGNMTRATGTQERVGGSPLEGARTLKGGKTQVGGFVEWMEGTRAIISLSKTADASTLFHEMTHVWQKDIPQEHITTLAKWLNTDPRVREWMADQAKRSRAAGKEEQALKFERKGNIVEYLPDGTWFWHTPASEAFTKMVEDIHSNPRLQSKLVPEAIRPAFEAMRGWLMRVFAGVNRGVTFLPSRAVREAYWDMFVPKGKTTGFGKFAEARVQLKSGRLGVNPSYVTLSEPKAMQAWFDLAAQTTKHQWPNQDELTKIARDIREGNPAEREAALGRQEAHMALPVDLTIAVQESAAASQLWFEKLSNAKTQAERMRIALEAPSAKEVQVMQRMRDLKSTAGRALAASGNMTDFMTALNGVRMLERSMTVNEVNRLTQAVDLMKAGHIGEATERLLEIHHSYKGFSHIQDIIIQVGYNARLSRPTTHAKNILSNTLWLGWQGAVHTPITAAGSALMGVLTGRQRTVFFQEIIPMLTAGWVHPQKALQAARHILMTGETPLEISHLDRGGKLEEIKSRGMNALENSEYAWANKAAPYISVPTRYLRAADLFFQIVAFDNFMAASDAKRAQLEGRYGAEAAVPYSAERMRVEAAKFARYATFTDAPGGMTRAVIQWKNHLPIVGFFTVPFVNTLANTMKRGLEHTPGIGFLAEKVNRMNSEKTRGEMYLPEAKEWHGVPVSVDIVAKQVEGLLLGFGLLTLFGGDDDRLVGARPTDPKEAKAFDASRKLENSIRVGDRWIQFGNFEPFGLALSAAANAYDRLKSYQRDTRIHAQGGDASPSAMREFVKLGDDLRTLLVNNSWAANLGGITERRARDEERMVKDYAKAIGFSLSSLVPYSGLLSSIGQQIEAYQNGGRVIAPETSSALVEMGYQVLPIAATVFERRQKLDVWGEPVEMKGKDFWAQWLPVRAAKASGDPVERELAKLVELGAGYYPDLPAKKLSLKLNGPMVEVPPELYTQYAVDFGRRSKAAVAELIASPRYQALPDDWKGAMKRTKLIDDRVTKVRDSANHKVKAEMRKLGLGKEVPQMR